MSRSALLFLPGVKGGIERAVSIMMPLMFTLLIGLGVYNIFAGGFNETVEWLFTPDFSKVGPDTLLAAVGQAFFSIGVGMGGHDDVRCLSTPLLFNYGCRRCDCLCGYTGGLIGRVRGLSRCFSLRTRYG